MVKEEKAIFGTSAPPRESDKLFGHSKEDWRLNACIEHWGDVDSAYKKGFRVAAFQLTERMCQNPSDQDSVVYPILYLYRHHIEMLLKSIFRLSASILKKTVSQNQRNNLERHDLLQLWGMIKPNLQPICEITGERPLPLEDLAGIASYMCQLNEHDPRGVSFRYGRERDMTRTIRDNLDHINIRSFAINMEKLADYLGGLEDWLGGLEDYRNAP